MPEEKEEDKAIQQNIAEEYGKYIAVGIYALLWAIFVYWVADGKLSIGFTLLNIPVSFLMYLIGKAFRNFTAPSFVISSEGIIDTFIRKIFWMIGPQIISMGIGTFVLYSLIY